MASVDVITANLRHVRNRIDGAAGRAGRDPSTVTLVAVSKTMTPETVRAAYAAGQRYFGENRVQEGENKICDLVGLTEANWHLVGHLQSNKAKTAARLFQMIESIDSLHLAQALSRQAIAIGRTIPVLLETNVSGEASKFGLTPNEVLGVASQVAALPGLDLQGLMTVAPLVPDPERARPVFRRLRSLLDELRSAVPSTHWQHLSMGMTGDFEVAVEEGATIVRIGRAIFGERQQ
jgi:PLP dependent protein